MASQAELSQRITEVLQHPVKRMASIGGGSFGRPYRVTSRDGLEFFVKVPAATGPSSLQQEAASLRWLAEASPAGGAEIASVIFAADDLLVLDWIPAGTPSRAGATKLGRGLAVTHQAGADHFGNGDAGYIASEPLPSGQEFDDWPSFYAGARLTPFLGRAVAARSITADDQGSVQEVIDRIEELAGPAEPPARLHGDLWSGNVVWTDDSAVLVDPSAHAGHRETDLAMLALFGLPHLDVVIDSYQQTRPLAEGWQRRVPLHQLYPLLVHATLFGAHYGRAAGATAREALAAARD